MIGRGACVTALVLGAAGLYGCYESVPSDLVGECYQSWSFGEGDWSRCSMPIAVRFYSHGGYPSHPGVTTSYRLLPDGTFVVTSNDGRTDVTCTTVVPPCDATSGFTFGQVTAALADADVQHAFSLTCPPMYGQDTTASDGVTFSLRLPDGRGFDAGDGSCGSHVPCTPIPPGIDALIPLLYQVAHQQSALPECVDVLP